MPPGTVTGLFTSPTNTPAGPFTERSSSTLMRTWSAPRASRRPPGTRSACCTPPAYPCGSASRSCRSRDHDLGLVGQNVPMANNAPIENPEPLPTETLPIVLCGDPVLRRAAGPVDPASLRRGDLAELIARMRVTMEAAPGVGLAAPQIGEPLQVAVLADDPERSRMAIPRRVPSTRDVASATLTLTTTGWRPIPGVRDHAQDATSHRGKTRSARGWRSLPQTSDSGAGREYHPRWRFRAPLGPRAGLQAHRLNDVIHG